MVQFGQIVRKEYFILILLVFAGALWVLYKSFRPQLIQEVEPTPSPTPVADVGIIEGSLSYPSEMIPEDLIVCAETLDKSVTFCTNEHLADENGQYTYGFGYQIEVPAGEYYVFAYLDNDPGTRAYYSEFVTCGLMAECPSHEPIEVAVSAGETVKEIDPHDWYAPIDASEEGENEEE